MVTSEKTRPQSIFPLLWVMLFDHTSLNITFPVLTLLFFDVQSSLFAPDTSHAVRSMWYGLCVAVPHIINIVMSPILSALSDEFGRKKILLLGTLGALLFALTSAFGIVCGMLSLLFLGRIIQGALSRTNPIAQAVIGDISSREKKVRNMGYLQSSISIGAFIGPVIGGYLASPVDFAQLNFSLPYFVAAIFAGISCVLTLVIFDETLLVKRSGAAWNYFNYQTIKKVITNPHVLRISVILLLSQISWSIYYQFIPPILKTALGFDAKALGIFVGMIAFWLALATTFGIRLLDKRFSLRQILFISLYMVLFGLLLSMFFCFWHISQKSFLLIWLAAVPTAIGDVIAYSCLITFYSNVVAKEEQGKVMGVCFIIIGLIWSLSAMFGGLLMSLYELLPLLVAPVGIILAIGLLHSRFGRELGLIE
jgi:DHA1 family tetracycline resistance protein-like MFS transporter